MKVLFIDSQVQDYSVFVESVNIDTFAIVYNRQTDSESVLALLLENNFIKIDRIGFVFHGKSKSDSDEYYLPLFLKNEPFFTSGDIAVSEDDINIYLSDNVSFIRRLIQEFSVEYMDFLACNLLLLDDWKSYFKLFPSSVIVGASDNNTGNLKYGGDWIMESTMEDVQKIYFTDAIQNYVDLLVLPSAVNSFYHVFYTFSVQTPTIINRTIYNNRGVKQDTIDISFGGLNIVDVLQIMNGSGTNPYSIGIIDSALNKASMDIAYCNSYTKSLTASQASSVITYVNNSFREPHTAAATVFAVTVSGGVYWISINGATPVRQPDLLLNFGKLYVFDQSQSSGAICTFSYSYNRSSVVYGSGVITNGTPGSLNAASLFDVPTDAPSLYYGSTGMGGNIYISARSVKVDAPSLAEVGTSFNVNFTTGTSSASYSITNIEVADFTNAPLLNGTIPAGTSQTISYNVGTSGKGKTMTVTTICGGTTLTNTIYINRTALTTTLYNPFDNLGSSSSYRRYNTAGYVSNGALNFLTGTVLLGDGFGAGYEAYIFFDNPTLITGFLYRNRMDAGSQYVSSAYLSYSINSAITTQDFSRLQYIPIPNGASSSWNLGSSNGAVSVTGTRPTTTATTEIKFTSPVYARVIKFQSVLPVGSTYQGFMGALKYKGNGLMTYVSIPGPSRNFSVNGTFLDSSCNVLYTSSTTTVNIKEYATRFGIDVATGFFKSNLNWINFVPTSTFSATDTLSIMCWVYLSATTAKDTFATFTDGVSAFGLAFGCDNLYLKLTCNHNFLSNAQSEVGIALSLYTWTHVCATMHVETGTGYGIITYYVNGINMGTFTEAQSWTANSATMFPSPSPVYGSLFNIGKPTVSASTNTVINKIRLFSTELDAYDVLNYYNND